MELRFTIPGAFERSKPYRRSVQDLAWAAVGEAPESEAKEWPSNVVYVGIYGINTMNTHRNARLFANMLHGVIYRKSSIIRQLGYREDNEGPRIEVVVIKDS